MFLLPLRIKNSLNFASLFIFHQDKLQLKNILINMFSFKKKIECALMTTLSATKLILLEINSYKSLVNHIAVTIYDILVAYKHYFSLGNCLEA